MTFAYHHPNYYKRVKREAASSKPQAPSSKPQAFSAKKLDKSSRVGYCGSQGQARDGMAIDICKGPLTGPRNSAAEILQLRGRYDRHEKIPVRARNGSCRIMVPDPRNSTKPQAPSSKPQAPSVKRSVRKIPEPRSTNQQ